MGSFADRLRALALLWGAPGLFLVAFLDSSFLSLPEIADLLVVYMVTQEPARMAIYAAAATLGSLGGCLVMYYLGRKGGEALVRKRFAGSSVDRAMRAFQRYGVMAVLVPSILPPPAPFKVFVLLAGAAGISVGRFVTAVVLGRGARYLALGLLAVKYGDRAMAYLHEHGVAASLVVLGVLATGFVAYLVWNRSQDQTR
ncbi:MAG: DedA family protein [Acidobacteria bacterium]|nr:DedA family protein [Acidobacteriota bacterium]